MAAADAYGILRTTDLHRAGLEGKDIAALVKAAKLTPLTRGWYAVMGSVTPEEWHRLATRALLRAHEGRALAAHHSALLLYDLPTYRADLARVRLTRRHQGSPRTRSARSPGRAAPDPALGDVAVAPALAVVQHGISSGPLSGLIAADAALLRQLIDPEDLNTALQWVHRHPGSRGVKAILPLADGRHESPGETRLAHTLHVMQVPVTPQVEITSAEFRAVVDFKVDGEMVVIEFDGRVKYSRTADIRDPFGRLRTSQQVLWDEKRREDHLRELGYEVVRVVWSDLDDPRGLARRIHDAIRRSQLRHRRPA